jgi:hypothetical protein
MKRPELQVATRTCWPCAKPAVSSRKHRRVITQDLKLAVSPRHQAAQDPERILPMAVHQATGQYERAPVQSGSWGQNSAELFQSVVIQTEDGRKFTFILRNLCRFGLHLLGTRSLLGQKVSIQVPNLEKEASSCFLVRIVWVRRVAEGVVECGGMFLNPYATAGPGLVEN